MKGNALLAAACAGLIFASSSSVGEFHFQHHFISRDLPASASGTGDYGLTALVDLVGDVDGDGDIDICSRIAREQVSSIGHEFNRLSFPARPS